MTDLAGWLDAREPRPPSSLRAAMLEAVAVADPGEGLVAERLAAAGLHVLGRVLRAPSTRSQALSLLAADALITYACEAAVDEDVLDEDDPVGRLLICKLVEERFNAEH